jgi:hypothetical protein
VPDKLHNWAGNIEYSTENLFTAQTWRAKRRCSTAPR